MNRLVTNAESHRRMGTTQICCLDLFTSAIDYLTGALGVTTLCPTTLSFIMPDRLHDDPVGTFQHLNPNADRLTYRSSVPLEAGHRLPNP